MQNDEEDENEDDTKLNNSWIDEFELSDKEYEQYYTENINEIKLQCIYVNINREIVQIKEKQMHLRTENCVSREELVGIIKRNAINNNVRYALLSLLKYNIDIEPQNIKQLFGQINQNQNQNPFLHQIKNIDAIPYNKTIPLFQKLNELLLLFYEKSDQTQQTQQNQQNQQNQQKQEQTKKIYIHKYKYHNHNNKNKHLKTQKHKII